MALTWLENSSNSPFPALENALDDGLIAVGGDLSAQRLLNAYSNGIFPWFNENDPILWWSPDPRMILFTDQIKVSNSLNKTLKNTSLSITMDRAFSEVMTACSLPRGKEDGTWIHPEMIAAYSTLHKQGVAHSVECWHGEELVGGLYGIAIGHIFFGESMFSTVRDSSKIALVLLCRQLESWGFPLIDCQIHSSHLASMGATEISREAFISYLNTYCQKTRLNTTWRMDTNELTGS